MPTYSTSRWSSFPSGPVQVTSADPRLFVSSDFGSGDKQEDLKERYIDGNPDNRFVVMYVDVPDSYDPERVAEFQDSFEEVARTYITETINPTTTKGKKRGHSLTLAPLLSENTTRGGKSVKVKVPPAVLQNMHESVPEEYRGKNELDLPRDTTWKFLFEITGVWHNSSQYGFTAKLRRGMWKKTEATARAKEPEDYEFADEGVEEDFEPAQRLDY